MSPDVVDYEDVEPRAPGMYFLRDALDCDHLGVTVLETEPGWEGMEHDHAEDGQEEVYVLVEGAATLTVEGETFDLSAGDAVRLDPEEHRQLETDEACTFVLVGAP